ncbi:MAG: phenylacetic acid degradation protein, partial [Thermoprotei archaeon]
KNELKGKVIEALKNVYDPEIPVNIYDLGLVYDVAVEDKKVIIKMTVTTPACPVAFMILDAAEASVKEALDADYEVEAELILDPPWTPLRITEEGRKELKEIYGYDIVEEWIKQMGGKV